MKLDITDTVERQWNEVLKGFSIQEWNYSGNEYTLLTEWINELNSFSNLMMNWKYSISTSMIRTALLEIRVSCEKSMRTVHS